MSKPKAFVSKITVATYVAYEFGDIDSKKTVKQVMSRNIEKASGIAPRHAVTFYFYDIVTTETCCDGKRTTAVGERTRISDMYHVAPKKRPAARVR